LSVTGAHAATFLNGITTVSIPEPNDSAVWERNAGAAYTAFLSAQGRIMYDVFIYPHLPSKGDAGFIVEYDPRAATDPSTSKQPPNPSLISLLKRFILRSKVRVRDVSEEWSLRAIWGGSAIDSRTPEWRWGRSGAVEPVYNASSIATPSDLSNGALWATDRRAPGMGVRVLVPKSSDASNSSSTLLPSEAYTRHRIKRGVPEGKDDMQPQDSFPMDANMDMMGGIDFRKGCYVGQELTVRTYHTGVIRKRTVPVQLAASSSPSETLSASIPAQTPIAVSWKSPAPGQARPRGTGRLLSSTEEGHALALMRLEHLEAFEAGAMALRVEHDGRTWDVIPRRPEWWPVAPESQKSSISV